MKKVIFVLLAVLLLGLLIWWVASTDSKAPQYYKHVELDTLNQVMNTTPDQDYLDTVVSVGLKELGVTGAAVLIQPMQDRIRDKFEASEGMELEAYIAEWMDGWTICVDPSLDRRSSIDIIAHELIHLKQYRDKDLILTGSTIVLWHGEKFDVLGISYQDRPWEREAFGAQRDLADKIRQQIWE